MAPSPVAGPHPLCREPFKLRRERWPYERLFLLLKEAVGGQEFQGQAFLFWFFPGAE